MNLCVVFIYVTYWFIFLKVIISIFKSNNISILGNLNFPVKIERNERAERRWQNKSLVKFKKARIKNGPNFRIHFSVK